MAEGNETKQPSASPNAGADADQAAAQLPFGPPEVEGELVCSFCRTRRDLSKVDEPRCRLCGRDDFVAPTQAELEEFKRQAERRGFCCPNPQCARPVEPLPGSEKFCRECGARTEKATPSLWFSKCVRPRLAGDAGVLAATRDGLIDAAWSMQVTREEAESLLDEYEASRLAEATEAAAEQGSPDGEAPGDAAGEREAVEGDGPAESAGDPDGGERERRALSFQRMQESYQLRRAMRVKFRVLLACVLLLACFILFSGRGSSNRQPEKPTPTPAPTAAAQAAQAAQAAPTPPPMVRIEGGRFYMGRDLDAGGDEYESPAHLVTVKPFFIDVYEVTREEYQRCVEAGKCRQPPDWKGKTYPPDTGGLPMTGVTWESANDYASWAGKRLPTEEEWEFAARGDDGRFYPWGRSWDAGEANVGSEQPVKVGSYKGVSPFGLFDMIGNAQEWTGSEWRRYPDKRAYMPADVSPETLRVIRGGSYKDSRRGVTATYRNALRMSGESSYAQTGFRCARDDDQP
jgi:formylglycine-generating enzyme required for sulfatase activity